MADYIDHFYVVEDLQANSPLAITKFEKLSDALNAYFLLPKDRVKALGVHTNSGGKQGNMPGALDLLQCKNGFDTVIEDWKNPDMPWWQNPEIQAAVHEITAVRNIHLYRHETGVTKDTLRKRLLAGETLDSILNTTDGQDCVIYKADRFYKGDTIVYIPDMFLNEIPYGRRVTSEEAEHIVKNCYTGDDIIQVCDGNMISARYLFAYIDWQHPGSALDELWEPDDAAPFWLGAK